MFLPSLAEQNVPSVLGGIVSRDSVGGCVFVVPIGPRVVRWYKAATGDGWIVTRALITDKVQVKSRMLYRTYKFTYTTYFICKTRLN
jgi:hypothetical protein